MNALSHMRLLPIVLVLFAASGATALIYEIVWYQLLQLEIGSSAVSLGILLATFMGGLCLGSLALARVIRRTAHPLRVYAAIEMGIGLCGIAVLWGLPLADRIYVTGLQHGMPGMALRGVFCALCLLAPTVLMGASLPAISRFIDSTPKGVRWWGWLYASNTLGAVAGCLVAGFYLLRLHDMEFATYVAAGINAVVALVALGLASASATMVLREAQSTAVPPPPASTGSWPIYLAIALSGATALGAEVVWTRQFAMMFDGTVYAFSIILAVFLGGLALGSGAGVLTLRFAPPRIALGWSQLLLAGGIAWAAYMINMVLPYQPVNLTGGGWSIAYDDLLRCMKALLPATILWGASFPLAMAAAAEDGGDSAHTVGRVYATNTLGGMIGALGVSLILIVWIGTRDTQRLMLALTALGGFLLLAPRVTMRRGLIRASAIGVGLAAGMAGVGALAWKMPAQPGNMVAYGRQLLAFAPYTSVLEVAEGRNSSLAITRYSDGILQISVAGHVEASNNQYDMRLQRMIGHLPALLHPHPARVLGIGFGAGVSAGSFTNYPGVKSITICELEPKVPPTSSKYFAPFDNNVMKDPRTHIVYDDGRHFLRTTMEKFDIIASDPLDVWVKGTAGIYSADYFEEVERHLNPGGYFTLYVPLYESDEETVRSEIATFFQVFPHGTVWANTAQGKGYDLVLMGQAGPLSIDIDAAEQRLRSSDYARVAESMRQIGFFSATDMYATFAGQETDLRPWLKGAQINTDRNLRLMYLAGWGINSQIEDPLYKTITHYRQLPQNIFRGSASATSLLYRQMLSGNDTD